MAIAVPASSTPPLPSADVNGGSDDHTDDFGVRLEWAEDNEHPAPPVDAPTDTPAPNDADEPVEVADVLDGLEDDAPTEPSEEAPPVEPSDDALVAAAVGTGERIPLLPAVFGGLADVRSSISTLSQRVDTLGATTTAFRSAISDQLTEYADAAARLSLSQAEALDGYRHGNDRSLTDLRRALGAGDEVVRRVAARVDELVTDTAALGDLVREFGHQLQSAGTDRDTLPAGADELQSLRAEIFKRLEELEELHAARDDDARSQIGALGRSFQQAFDQVATTSHFDAIKSQFDEISGLFPRALEEIGSRPQLDLDPILDDLADLRTELRSYLAAPAPSDDAQVFTAKLYEELAALREEVVQLKRRVGVRGRPAQDAGAGLSDEDIARVVAAITQRLEDTFEVVPDRENESGTLPAKPKTSAAAKKASPSPRRRSR